MLIRISASPAKNNKANAAVRFAEEEQENESEALDKSLEGISMKDTATASATNVAATNKGQPTEKLFAHQFYDVYAGMTDDEWIKVRNAFMAQFFDD